MKARAHTNIALIKYWGKADAKLRLPLMSSISMTLDQFYTDTEITPAESDEFWLNGQLQTDRTANRVFNYLDFLRDKYQIKTPLSVKSVNHVPTAAGLASSSSAFAALAACFNYEFDLNLSKRELSKLARIGSGSATRSVYGGFVKWEKGNDDDSSFAIALDEHPSMDLQMLAVELNQREKKLSSTAGMKLATSSPFYQPWLVRNELELNEMQAAISQNDFTKLGQLAELSACEMHAVNLTAKPTFTYFEPNTLRVINLVTELRKQGIECYFTIDAGPNVKLLCQKENVKEIISQVQALLGSVKIVQATFGEGVKALS